MTEENGDLIKFLSPIHNNHAATTTKAVLPPNANLLDSTVCIIDSFDDVATNLINLNYTKKQQFTDCFSPVNNDVRSSGNQNDNENKTVVTAGNESDVTNSTNDSNLDYIDIIDNSDLVNVTELEENWLIDPKELELKKNQRANKSGVRKKLLEDTTNTSANNNINTESQSRTTNNNMNTSRNKNSINWLMEEFDDKNLEKAKRTLLVALDDISRGLARRSRSVSTTRTPYNGHHTNVNTNFINQPQNNQNHPVSKTNVPPNIQQHQKQQHNDSHYTDSIENLTQNTTHPNSQFIQQSKSIESILNDSCADVIDGSNFQLMNNNGGGQQIKNGNYSTATITKRRDRKSVV